MIGSAATWYRPVEAGVLDQQILDHAGERAGGQPREERPGEAPDRLAPPAQEPLEQAGGALQLPADDRGAHRERARRGQLAQQLASGRTVAWRRRVVLGVATGAAVENTQSVDTWIRRAPRSARRPAHLMRKQRVERDRAGAAEASSSCLTRPTQFTTAAGRTRRAAPRATPAAPASKAWSSPRSPWRRARSRSRTVAWTSKRSESPRTTSWPSIPVSPSTRIRSSAAFNPGAVFRNIGGGVPPGPAEGSLLAGGPPSRS